MLFAKKPLAQAITLSVAALSSAVFAQASPEPTGDKKPQAAQKVEVVEITGIRASLQKSITAKKNADTNVEVITAEDVGKMPDKNIADALSRLPGVNVQFGGALALDEAERVSIRGTSPNLNLTTVNGHALSSGDWHVGDQGASGRSVGFGLMPSQLIGQTFVYKTARADVTEGGVSGSVDIRTIRPLDLKKRFTADASLGLVYTDLPKKTDPQVSALFGWKNDSDTMGAVLQLYREDRHLRRDGQEVFSYATIGAGTAAAKLNPELAGKRIPNVLNSALFTGLRERQGAYLGVQIKPSSAIDLNLTAFRSTLKADNYNSSAFAFPGSMVGAGGLLSGYTINGDVVTGARIAPPVGKTDQLSLEFDHIARDGAKSLSAFYDLDGAFRVNDRLSFKARVGYTEGSGKTRNQPQITWGIFDAPVNYQLNTGRPADWSITNAAGQPIDVSNTANYKTMPNTAASVNATDKENYGHVDGDYKIAFGPLTNLKFGARLSKHDRGYEVVAGRFNLFNGQTCPANIACFLPAGLVPAPGTAYPANYAAGIDATFPRNFFRYTPDQLAQFAKEQLNWDPVLNKVWTSGYTVKEKNTAGYLMTEFEQGAISGNVGARFVETEVVSLAYQSITAKCPVLLPCSVPNAISSSRYGTYLPQEVITRHTDVLPSMNVRWELNRDLIGRFAVGKSLGRPNYNELAAAISLNDTLLTGSGGNPKLKPITSTNVDASLAWYFAPRAYVSGGVFYQDIKDYVKTGVSKVELFNITSNALATYDVTSRIGVDAKVKGAEAAVEMPIAGGFGVGANITYVDSKDRDGLPLLGTSKTTYNLRAFYEDEKLSASLAWNARSDYAIAFVGNGTNTPLNGQHRYAGSGTLALSLGYKFSDKLSLVFDANNLNNPVRHTYFITENATGYWHQSGRQYFMTLRAKL